MDNDSSPKPGGWGKSDFEEKVNGLEESSDDLSMPGSDFEEDDDEYQGCENEAEVVADENSEEYKENTTGLKIKYDLMKKDVEKFIRHNEVYREQRKIRIKYVIIQLILLLILSLMAAISGSSYYIFMAGVPFFFFFLFWLVSFVNLRLYFKKLLKDRHFTVDIFPNRLEIETEHKKSVIHLDGTYKCEERDNLIIVSKPGQRGIIIPLRAAHPDVRPEIEAMILSGCNRV